MSKAKIFKNTQKLDMDELLIYLQSTHVAQYESVEIGCYLNNFQPGDNARSLCVVDGRRCGKSYVCEQLNKALQKLDNPSSATELQELMQPVLKYREQRKREAMAEQWTKGQYRLSGGAKELLCRKDITPDDMVGFRIEIEYNDGQTDWIVFNEPEIQVEFRLRAMRVDAAQKEKKRLEMLKEIYNYDEGAMTFWKKLME